MANGTIDRSTRYSLLATRYSLLATRFSLLAITARLELDRNESALLLEKIGELSIPSDRNLP